MEDIDVLVFEDLIITCKNCGWTQSDSEFELVHSEEFERSLGYEQLYVYNNNEVKCVRCSKQTIVKFEIYEYPRNIFNHIDFETNNVIDLNQHLITNNIKNLIQNRE